MRKSSNPEFARDQEIAHKLKKNTGISNKDLAEELRKRFKVWKDRSLRESGYFPIFQPFKETFLLKKLSGNAVKLYLYLGLASGNKTGETWVSIETIAKYFDKSPRTISNWIKELEEANLIERMQFKHNEVAHTFLVRYGRYGYQKYERIEDEK